MRTRHCTVRRTAARECSRSMQEMMQMRRSKLVWQVTKSTAISSATLLFAIVALSLWWNVPDYNPETTYAETRGEHFRYCVAIMSLNLFIPLAICFVASIAVALVRGKHNMIAGAMSGMAILALTALEYSVNIHHHSLIIRRIILLGAIPLIAASLQFVRMPRSKRTSNQRVEHYGA